MAQPKLVPFSINEMKYDDKEQGLQLSGEGYNWVHAVWYTPFHQAMMKFSGKFVERFRELFGEEGGKASDHLKWWSFTTGAAPRSTIYALVSDTNVSFVLSNLGNETDHLDLLKSVSECLLMEV